MAFHSSTARQASDPVSEFVRQNRVWGCIVAACMVVLGIMFVAAPVRTNYAWMVVATIGFIVYGAYLIYVYIRTPSGYRDGWTLANGILFILLGFLVLWDNPREMYLTYAFTLGFLCVTGGILQCTNFGVIHGAGESGAAWVLISGILNIIVGVFFLFAPFAATWAMAYVAGIYLIVGGIALFAQLASGHLGLRK